MLDASCRDSHQSQPLGEPIGQVSSTSEKVQLVLLGGCLGMGLLASVTVSLPVPLLVWLFAGIAVAFALQAVAAKAPRFCSTLTVFEHGVQIAKPAAPVKTFSYQNVTQYQMTVTEHHSKVATRDVYVGSRADFRIYLADSFTPVLFNLEFDRRKESGNLIDQVSLKLCDAIELNLMRQLDEAGELPLNENVVMTLDELQITDPRFGTKRTIALDAIGEFRSSFESTLMLTKRGDGLPLIELKTDYPNFYPTLSLLCRLHKTYTDQQDDAIDANEEGDASAISQEVAVSF
ncbi:MAG: hypothetical protein WBD31_28275 [Rubripirellula sp.]